MSAAASVLTPVRGTFRAVARTVVPDTAGLDEAGWRVLEGIVETALAERPPRMRRQLVVFIRLIDLAARVRHGRSFAALPSERGARLLERFQDSPVLLLRRGFWGLRTLVYMGWYAQPEIAERIGYRGHIRGWNRTPGLIATEPLPAVSPAREVGPLP